MDSHRKDAKYAEVQPRDQVGLLVDGQHIILKGLTQLLHDLSLDADTGLHAALHSDGSFRIVDAQICNDEIVILVPISCSVFFKFLPSFPISLPTKPLWVKIFRGISSASLVSSASFCMISRIMRHASEVPSGVAWIVTGFSAGPEFYFLWMSTWDWVCLVMFFMVKSSFPMMAPTNWVRTRIHSGKSICLA